MQLGVGLHALSNAPNGVDWPKTVSARTRASELLGHDVALESWFALLAEGSTATSGEERYSTAHFIVGPVYGTRCSTIVLIDAQGVLTFAERAFDADGRLWHEVRETFTVSPQPDQRPAR
jgi:uncharacterized protein with NRDE domain